jgi:Ethylbenzene dehydrogenase
MKNIVLLAFLVFTLSQAQLSLTAVKVDETSLDANAAFWTDAPKIEQVTKPVFEGEPDGPTVTLQAAYDGEYITIRAQWTDPTESILRRAWIWDGSAFSQAEEEQDRFVLTWPIGNNAEFASKGCTAACHGTDNDDPKTWWMGSESEDVSYDNWHWKASETNAAGYTDDNWWGLKDADRGHGRKDDAKDSGGYVGNINEEETGPLFMSSEGTSATFILKGKEIAIDTSILKAGDRIPRYLQERAVGSRGDIESIGTWQDGNWMLVMRRALDTGHEDDAVLIVGKPIPLGVAVLENAEDADHTIIEDVVILEWQ